MRSTSAWVAILLLLAVNTAFLWDKLPGGWDFLLFLILGCVWFVLLCVFVLKVFGLIIDRFSDRNNIVSVVIIAASLVFSFLFPTGLVRSEFNSKPAVLVASREGVANCKTTLKLYEGSEFVLRSACFGIHDQSGTYEIIGDTVKMIFEKMTSAGVISTYAIINRAESGSSAFWGNLFLFQIPSDSIPLTMHISKMELVEK